VLHLKKVLVPRDFSRFSDYAFERAMELVSRTGAELHIVYADVLHTDISTAGGGGAETAEVLNERLLEGTENLIAEHGIHVVTSIVRDLASASAIVTYAGDNDIDLIIMGTHGRRGFRRLLIGSTAEEVARTSPCPVMTIRKPADTEEKSHRTPAILVPVDFSKHSQKALHHAKELAAMYHTSLDLLHVVEEQMHPAFYNTGVFSITDLIPDVDVKALAELKKFYNESSGPVCGVQFHVSHGRAGKEIASFAERHDSEMIVMSTHGLTGIEHVLLGSVTEKVIRWSPAPVLSVTTKGKVLVTEQVLLEEESH
jgi:nucleotide-binding universal stress UspA family protein